MPITRNKFIRIAAVLTAVLIALVAAYTWFTLTWSYSKGSRAGYVQKFSKKGWLVKTWEGELQMVPVPGATPEKFLFTVRDEAVAQKLAGMLGKRVTLSYEQHKGVPTRLFGETEYFVTDALPAE